MNNEELKARKDGAFARGQGTMVHAYIERAINAELWDVEGKRYIDLGAGIAVVNTGHSHPKVVAAVKEQVENFSHTCVMVTPYVSAVELAERLNDIAPGNTPKKTIFVTTGAEAVENCVKIARAHTGRSGVIAFNGGFHGRTNLTMGLTGKVAPYKAGFGPFPGDIYHAPFPNAYHGVSVEDSLKALNNLFICDIEPNRVAAIIIEPVQGEGGFYAAPPEFMQKLRAICDEHGIVFVADEIQTGFARTGKMFASEYSCVEPDLITMAKGIAGGYPIAAVVGKAEIMDAPNPGGLGGTYGGSPIGCVAALAVLDIIEEEKLIERSNQIGERIVKSLTALQEKYPLKIGNVRNLGAMIAMEMVNNGDADQPDSENSRAMVAEASNNGLIILSCGIRGNVIRFLPALTISDELIDEAMVLLEKTLDSVLAK